jgi:hypothetical protein
MNIFKKIFSKKSKPVTMEEIKEGKYFICHYCQKPFIIDKNKIFPLNVQSTDSKYFFQGKGYLCPHCQKNCIIG